MALHQPRRTLHDDALPRAAPHRSGLGLHSRDLCPGLRALRVPAQLTGISNVERGGPSTHRADPLKPKIFLELEPSLSRSFTSVPLLVAVLAFAPAATAPASAR